MKKKKITVAAYSSSAACSCATAYCSVAASSFVDLVCSFFSPIPSLTTSSLSPLSLLSAAHCLFSCVPSNHWTWQLKQLPKLGVFTRLHSLSASCNELQHIPSELAKHGSLTFLDLTMNCLAVLPSNLSDLVCLQGICVNLGIYKCTYIYVE